MIMIWPFDIRTRLTDLSLLISIVLHVLLCIAAGADGAITYKYLGCYADGNVRDIDGKDLSFSTLSLEVCASQCISSGFPFLGLQSGTRCFCGSSFGRYGPSTGCNVTCGSFYCGGYMANDVYYTVDNSVASERILKAYNTTETFGDARAQCIRSSGDIAIIDTSTAKDSVLAELNYISSGSSGILAWIGLYSYPLSGNLEWTDENVRPFSDHPSDYASYWAAGEPKLSGACVAVNTSTKLLQTMPCSTTLPYICKQIPPQPVTPETTYPTAPAESKGGLSESNKRLALYIVLPIFFFCYGGSCLVYCLYKIYKNCCRSSNQHSKMILEKTSMYPRPPQPTGPPPVPLFTQPLGKPKYIAGDQVGKGKGPAGLGIMTVPGKQPSTYDGPAQLGGAHGFTNPAYLGSQKRGPPSLDRKVMAGSQTSGRPEQAGTESGDLIDLKAPQQPLNAIMKPAHHQPSYEEMRNDSRARKLENAAQQARDRRLEREKSGVEQSVNPSSARSVVTARSGNGPTSEAAGTNQNDSDAGSNPNNESITKILLKKVSKQ